MNTRTRRRINGAAGLLAATAALVALAASANAGSAGQWTQITRAHNGAGANLGLARGKNGALHVFWAGPARAPFSTITDTQVSPAGVVGRKSAVVSGWDSVQAPAAVAARGRLDPRPDQRPEGAREHGSVRRSQRGCRARELAPGDSCVRHLRDHRPVERGRRRGDAEER